MKVVCFGAFEVNVRTGESRKHGIRVKLQGQPYQILAMLLDRPGEVVTREEIRRQLWPSDTFVEFEDGVNSAVKKLRHVLGDSPDHPVYVETIPRVGYRFIAPVREPRIPPIADTLLASSSSEPALPRAAARVRASSRGWVSGLALLAAVLLAWAAYAFFSPWPQPRILRVFQLNPSNPADPWAGIASDGARVFFSERAGDHWNVMETSVSGGEARLVEAPLRNTRVFDVAPDRSAFLIGGFESPGHNLPLWIWPVQGGRPSRVGNVFADEAAWGPGAQDISYVRGNDVHIVRLDGSDDRILFHALALPFWLRWSPDGTRLSFTLHDQARTRVLWEADSSGAHLHVRFPGLSNPHGECCGAWTRDGRYFLYTTFGNGSSDLWALREGRSWMHWRLASPVRLTSGANSFWGTLLAGSGSRLFALDANVEFECVQYSLASRQFTPFHPTMRILDLDASRDGDWVAFQRMPDWSLWRSRLDGSALLQLVASPIHAAHPRWSPDGKQVAFEGTAPGGEPTQAYVVKAEGGAPRRILPQPQVQNGLAWSSDGASVAMAIYDKTDGARKSKGIEVVNLKTRETYLLPGSQGLDAPLWSPDGEYLIAASFDERELLRFDSRAKSWTPIFQGMQLSGATWSSDSKSLYVQDMLEPGEPVYRLRAGDFQSERFASFEALLATGVSRCAFQGLAHDGSLMVTLTRGGVGIYAMDLDLP